MMKIKRTNVMIAFSQNDHLQITSVLVYDKDDEPLTARRLSGSIGCCDSEWLQEGQPLDTPMGQFLWLSAAYGFASTQALAVALKEFSKIEGQAVWTNELLDRRGLLLTD